MVAFGLVGGSVAMIFSPDTQPVVPPVSQNQFADIMKALEEAEKQVRDHPEDVTSRMLLAKTYVDIGQMEKAVEQYRAVLEIDPDQAAARLSLAEGYYVLGENHESLAEVERVLQANPEHQRAYFLAGIILGEGLEDYPAAVAKMERFVELAGSGPYVDEAKAKIEEWSNK